MDVERTEAEKKAMRLAVAQDVLDSIGTIIKPEIGVYLGIPVQDFPEEVKGQTDAQAYIPHLRNCRACALGSCILSLVKLDNNCPVEGWEHFPFSSRIETSLQNVMRKRLATIFSSDQIINIEAAFECEDDYWAWGCQFSDDSDRLVAIMENIIANDGTFVVPQDELGYSDEEEDDDWDGDDYEDEDDDEDDWDDEEDEEDDELL